MEELGGGLKPHYVKERYLKGGYVKCCQWHCHVMMGKRDKTKIPLFAEYQVQDYVLQKAKLMAKMKMSGGNKPSRKIQAKGGENIGRGSCIPIVRR